MYETLHISIPVGANIRLFHPAGQCGLVGHKVAVQGCRGGFPKQMHARWNLGKKYLRSWPHRSITWIFPYRDIFTSPQRTLLSLEQTALLCEFLSPSGDLGISLVWHNLSPDRTTHILVRLLKSSSNWTKSSMMGPQLFLGWYQMILDVQTRFRLGSE